MRSYTQVGREGLTVARTYEIFPFRPTRRILSLPERSLLRDAQDCLAMSLCHADQGLTRLVLGYSGLLGHHFTCVFREYTEVRPLRERGCPNHLVSGIPASPWRSTRRIENLYLPWVRGDDDSAVTSSMGSTCIPSAYHLLHLLWVSHSRITWLCHFLAVHFTGYTVIKLPACSADECCGNGGKQVHLLT